MTANPSDTLERLRAVLGPEPKRLVTVEAGQIIALLDIAEAAKESVVAYDDKLGASWRNSVENLRAKLAALDAAGGAER